MKRCAACSWPSASTVASLDELAEAAGLNRPSLYAAFGDKEQLYIHAPRFYGDRSVAGLEAILGRKGTIEQRLGKVYKAAIELYTRPPSAQGCMTLAIPARIGATPADRGRSPPR